MLDFLHFLLSFISNLDSKPIEVSSGRVSFPRNLHKYSQSLFLIVLFLEYVPGTSNILSKTRTYDLQYKLKFQAVGNRKSGATLYYIVRYNNFVWSKKYEWRSVTVAAKPRQKVFTVSLDTLDWGDTYSIEVYAGNSHGLGRPAKKILRRPYG